MSRNVLENALFELFFFFLDVSSETDRRLSLSRLDDLVERIERAAAYEENILCIDLDKLLIRVLAPALRRNIGNCSLKNLEKSLLYSLTRYVARN